MIANIDRDKEYTKTLLGFVESENGGYIWNGRHFVKKLTPEQLAWRRVVRTFIKATHCIAFVSIFSAVVINLIWG